MEISDEKAGDFLKSKLLAAAHLSEHMTFGNSRMSG